MINLHMDEFQISKLHYHVLTDQVTFKHNLMSAQQITCWLAPLRDGLN